ncbi:uncharacterized protein EV422DRAFT_568921 [Fimicolochytrium jonesii]|uniref:uncharacterized protein n=1 Tax=Fimicolochytrium jonesii TaxID=1396493 RepID=UPI0022FED967|nr:uncharacterized protein EV422DRAFT_568921 [Fimicolochytrium jonesii]KAI8819492.1 hypothetical protein EV422DRAFT_568921 [Fimicolochytrium jonesii]
MLCGVPARITLYHHILGNTLAGNEFDTSKLQPIEGLVGMPLKRMKEALARLKSHGVAGVGAEIGVSLDTTTVFVHDALDVLRKCLMHSEAGHRSPDMVPLDGPPRRPRNADSVRKHVARRSFRARALGERQQASSISRIRKSARSAQDTAVSLLARTHQLEVPWILFFKEKALVFLVKPTAHSGNVCKAVFVGCVQNLYLSTEAGIISDLVKGAAIMRPVRDRLAVIRQALAANPSLELS